MAFLPCTKEDCMQRGWDELDFLFISADAYVDHPSFGAAVLTRLLEAEGYRVGVVAQPDPDDTDSIAVMGRPRLGVLVSSGVVDSMVNNYTAARRKRSNDRYAPGGQAGKRPDRVTIRYCNMVRARFGDIPLIVGGMEPSLRRFAHYDYWDNRVRRSVLQDSRANILVYGMGETALLRIADLLSKGVPVDRINALRGTCVLASRNDLPNRIQDFIGHPDGRDKDTGFPADSDHVLLPAFEQVRSDRKQYALAFRIQYLEQNPSSGRTLIQPHGGRYLVQNPPNPVLPQKDLDRLYTLPYERRAHPMYDEAGGVPAIEEVSNSITAHRGCFGSCNFCAITFHQGRIVQPRSDASILEEADIIRSAEGFKGYIHDVGGPTANFHQPACERMERGEVCRNRRCMFPKPCPNLNVDHGPYLKLLRAVRSLPGVKKVFIRSGIRFDYLMADPDPVFMDELCQHHVSGQLKVAPEHTVPGVLRAMGKPGPDVFEKFREAFRRTNERYGKKQYLVPYFISGHPGCTLNDAVDLAVTIRRNRVVPEQVQDFYPTPGTVSTTMYHTGLDPFTLRPVHVPDAEEKVLQRALLQFSRPDVRGLVLKALNRTGRNDLVGFGKDCLVRPERRSGKGRKPHREEQTRGNHHQRKRAGSDRQGRSTGQGRRDKGTNGKNSRSGRHTGR